MAQDPAEQQAVNLAKIYRFNGGRIMEKFNTATIAHVTGYTVSTITSWAAKNEISVKDGLTITEIIDFLHAPKIEKKAGKVDEHAAARLRTALEVLGAMNPVLTLEG